MTSGTPPARKHAHGGMADGPVWQHIDEARHATVDLHPLLDDRPPQPGGMRDGREWSRRFVEPPNAACTTMALRTAGS